MESELRLKLDAQHSAFNHFIGSLRRNGTYTDVTVVCDGKFYPLHKFVLAFCSEYFSEILEKTSGTNPMVVLTGIPCSDLELLLDCMYIDEVNVRKDKLPSLMKSAELLRVKNIVMSEKQNPPLPEETSTESSTGGSCTPGMQNNGAFIKQEQDEAISIQEHSFENMEEAKDMPRTGFSDNLQTMNDDPLSMYDCDDNDPVRTSRNETITTPSCIYDRRVALNISDAVAEIHSPPLKKRRKCDRVEKKVKTLIKLANQLEELGDMVALIHIPKGGKVKYYGNSCITGFVSENWKLIEKRPGFMEITRKTRNIISPPPKPISEMSRDDSREFAIAMTTKLLGQKKGFGDLSKKPVWWPDEVDWMTKVFGRGNSDKDKDKNLMVRADYQAIIKAYFDYQNMIHPVAKPQPKAVLHQQTCSAIEMVHPQSTPNAVLSKIPYRLQMGHPQSNAVLSQSPVTQKLQSQSNAVLSQSPAIQMVQPLSNVFLPQNPVINETPTTQKVQPKSNAALPQNSAIQMHSLFQNTWPLASRATITNMVHGKIFHSGSSSTLMSGSPDNPHMVEPIQKPSTLLSASSATVAPPGNLSGTVPPHSLSDPVKTETTEYSQHRSGVLQ